MNRRYNGDTGGIHLRLQKYVLCLIVFFKSVTVKTYNGDPGPLALCVKRMGGALIAVSFVLLISGRSTSETNNEILQRFRFNSRL